MDLLASSIPTVVIGLATAILALSLLVRVLQELWKFLSSSRATCYTKAMLAGDFWRIVIPQGNPVDVNYQELNHFFPGHDMFENFDRFLW